MQQVSIDKQLLIIKVRLENGDTILVEVYQLKNRYSAINIEIQ